MKDYIPENDIKDSITKLVEYREEGYVFHGSTNPNLEKLVPNKAIDDGNPNDEFNNDTAIFASSNPAASIIFATVSFDNIPKEKWDKGWGIGGSINSIKATIPVEYKEYILNGKGFVYVLPKEGFADNGQSGSWEVKSKKEVTPIDKVEVEFTDFEKLGGRIEWV